MNSMPSARTGCQHHLESVIQGEYGLLKAECLSLPLPLSPMPLPSPTLSPSLALSWPPGMSPGALLVGVELTQKSPPSLHLPSGGPPSIGPRVG